MVTPFLVTGCGRSGTKWAAELFTALGFPCGHEEIFSYDREGPLTASESSWLAVPHLDSLPPSTPVLRIMRDPFQVVQSIMAKGFLADMADPFAVFVALHRPDIAAGRDHLARAIRYVALWDEPLHGRVTRGLRVEAGAHDVRLAVKHMTGDQSLSKSQIQIAMDALGTTVNTSATPQLDPALVRREIRAHPDGDLIAARAERFRYERS